MNVAQFLHKAARTYPDSAAVQQAGERVTYAQLERRVASLAGGLLSQDARPGDRIGIWMTNSPSLVDALFAVFWAGLVAVPLNARLHASEVEYILDDAGARLFIYDDALATAYPGWPGQHLNSVKSISMSRLPYAPVPAPLADRAASDDAWLFYTSGTTGKPKGAVLTHGNLVAESMNCLADIYSFQPEDVVLHAAPLTHGSGLYLLPAVARAALNVIAEGSFSPAAVFKLIADLRVTAIAFIAPTQIVALIEAAEAKNADMSSVRAIIYGGGPMYVQHIRKALDLWGPIFVQLYGQGESPMTGTYLRRDAHLGQGVDRDRRLSSIGIPRTDVELEIVDELDRPLPAGEVGEICLRAPTIMKGYWRNQEATEAALRGGWLHTGDLAYQDADGYVHLVDRAKDLIISGGNNIYAREVEDVILTHPAVVEVAVIGVPDAYWGESVHAVVVLRSGRQANPEEIIDLCRQHLASYKKPRSVEFVDRLPKNAYGKIVKRELREPHWAGRDRLIGGSAAGTSTRD